MQTELNVWRMLGVSGLDDAGCIAMNDPEFEQPYGLGEQSSGCGHDHFLSRE